MSTTDPNEAVEAAAQAAVEKLQDAASRNPDLVAQLQEKAGEIGDKAKAALSDPDFLTKVESISDKIIGGLQDAAKKVIPEEHHTTVDDVAAKIDKALGNE